MIIYTSHIKQAPALLNTGQEHVKCMHPMIKMEVFLYIFIVFHKKKII